MPSQLAFSQPKSLSASTLSGRKRPFLEMKWAELEVSLTVPAPREEAFELFSSLDQHPRWSPWLHDVQYDREQGKSMWVLRQLGVEVSWEAENTVERPPHEIAWESRTGLSNKGRVVFDDVGNGRCAMTLTLSYDLPRAISEVLRIKAIDEFVRSTLLDVRAPLLLDAA